MEAGRSRDSSRNEKRGLVQAPSLELTPQKPEPESRFGSGHPGKPISFKVAERRASDVPVRRNLGRRLPELIARELAAINKVTCALRMSWVYKISQNLDCFYVVWEHWSRIEKTLRNQQVRQ